MSAPAAADAREALDRAFVEVQGNTPCREGDGEMWHGDQAERLEAAAACRRCPIVGPCHAYALASAAAWGVWGATDFEDAAARRRAHRQTHAARRATDTSATTTATEETS